jgi:hypothetical protein
MALENPTVLEVLTSLARENGALSWTIRYERAPATIDTATILFMESGGYTTVATPPGASDPTAPPAPNAVRVSAFNELANMIADYRRQTGAPVSFEQLPLAPSPRRVTFVSSLNLAGLSHGEAIRRLVAHDSRYEVVERAGRFMVRPRTASATSPLDTVLPSFVRVDEPFDAAIGGLLQRLNLESSSTPTPQFSSPGRGGSVAASMEAARQKPISVSFQKPVTLREVLDALCQAAGSFTWTFRMQSMIPGRASYALEISSPEGWSLHRSFSLAAPVVATKRPDPGIPPSLDRDINRIFLPTVGGVWSPFLNLASAARTPFGVELAPGPSNSPDPRLTKRADLPSLGPGRLSDAIYVLLERMPETGWIASGGMLNFGPAETIRQPEHFLNQRVGRFEVTGLPASSVIALLRRRMSAGPGATATPAANAAAASLAPRSMAESALARPVTLRLENPTAREVLNAIATQLGNLNWIVMYESAEAGQAARAREADSVIVFTPMQSSGIDGVRFNRDGTTGRVTPARVTIPAGPRVMIDLPIDDRGYATQVNRLCQTLSIRCTIEVTTTIPAALRGPGFQPPTATYDFTGMPLREALDKLVEVAPDLTWQLDGQIYRIRSRSLAKGSSLPLDRRVPTIDLTLNTLSSVQQAVRTFFAPVPPPGGRRGAPVPTGPTSGVTGGIVSPPGIAPVTQGPGDRTVVISLKNATIREFLDEVAKQYGDLSWSVRYLEANGMYLQLELMLSGSNFGSGWTIDVR